MPRTAYVNGAFVDYDNASVHIDDRGYQFADSVYEVCLVVDGEFWDEEGHFQRLERSLSFLGIPQPASAGAYRAIIGRLLRLNRLRTALVYIQVSRGVATRNHAFPAGGDSPQLIMTARPFDLGASDAAAETGVAVMTTEDIRWRRVDIKTTNLLPNVLAKQKAVENGAAEAWLVRDDHITEGSCTNAWIVDKAGVLRTHPATHDILGGITRQTVLECARHAGLQVEERAFSVHELIVAREAFFTSATSLVMPVVKVDGAYIANGAPGSVATTLRRAYREKCAAAK